ncbi:unnamed protein product, partial [Ectocarpus sp. 12 AP-2014]
MGVLLVGWGGLLTKDVGNPGSNACAAGVDRVKSLRPFYCPAAVAVVLHTLDIRTQTTDNLAKTTANVELAKQTRDQPENINSATTTGYGRTCPGSYHLDAPA